MIGENFNVTNYKRLVELQKFIKNNMPTCRFKGNPIKFRNGSYRISLEYAIEDINKLNTLHNHWYNVDNVKEEKKNFWKKIFKK